MKSECSNSLISDSLTLFIIYLMTVGGHDSTVTLSGRAGQLSRIERRFVFVEGQRSITIGCPFIGNSDTKFTWKKNGLVVADNESRISVDESDGTLEIIQPTFGDQGIYWCNAFNQYGRAAMPEVDVTSAVLHRFLSSNPSRPTFHDVTVGRSFRMTCQAPLSHPPCSTYWAVFNPVTARLRNLDLSERVQTDFDGGLYFSHVEASDDLGDESYVCVASNKILGKFVQGDYRRLVVHDQIEAPKCIPASLMWSTPNSDVALLGTTKRLKCIFSGRPTPLVTWSREDGRPLNINLDGGRFSLVVGNQGAELIISNITLEDEGTFLCTAWNQATQHGVLQNQDGGCFDKAKVHLSLRIESPPRWHDGRPPPLLIQGEDDGEIVIEANVVGRPRPELVWLSNGVPLSDVKDKRLSLRNERFRLSNITSADKQILQLRASNVHGMLVANIAIEVKASPPQFEVRPQAVVDFQVGSSVKLLCKVKGHPSPQITWSKVPNSIGKEDSGYSKSGVQEASEEVFQGSDKIFANGSTSVLLLKNVTMTTVGQYRCRAKNKFGQVVGETFVTIRDSSESFGIFISGYTWLIILPVLVSFLVGVLMILLLITCRKKKSKTEIYKVPDRELLYAVTQDEHGPMDEMKMQTLSSTVHQATSDMSKLNADFGVVSYHLRHALGDVDCFSDSSSMEKKSSSTASIKSLPRPQLHLGPLIEASQADYNQPIADLVLATPGALATSRDVIDMDNVSPCGSFNSGNTVIHSSHHQRQKSLFISTCSDDRLSPSYAAKERPTRYESAADRNRREAQPRCCKSTNQSSIDISSQMVQPFSHSYGHQRHQKGVATPSHKGPFSDIMKEHPQDQIPTSFHSLEVVEPDLCLSVSTVV